MMIIITTTNLEEGNNNKTKTTKQKQNHHNLLTVRQGRPVNKTEANLANKGETSLMNFAHLCQNHNAPLIL